MVHAHGRTVNDHACRLGQPRQLRNMNSWLHNLPALAKDRRFLEVGDGIHEIEEIYIVPRRAPQPTATAARAGP